MAAGVGNAGYQFSYPDLKTMRETKGCSFSHTDGRKLSAKKVNGEIAVKVERFMSLGWFVSSDQKSSDIQLAHSYKVKLLANKEIQAEEIIASVSSKDELMTVLKQSSSSTVLAVGLLLTKHDSLLKIEGDKASTADFVKPELENVFNREFIVELAKVKPEVVIQLLQDVDFNQGQFNFFEIMFEAFDEADDKAEIARLLDLRGTSGKEKFIDFLWKKSYSEPEKVLNYLSSLSSLDVDQEVLEVYLNSLESFAISREGEFIDLSLVSSNRLKLSESHKPKLIRAFSKFPITAMHLVNSGIFDRQIKIDVSELEDVSKKDVIELLIDRLDPKSVKAKDIRGILTLISASYRDEVKVKIFETLANNPKCDASRMSEVCHFMFPKMSDTTRTFRLEPSPLSLDEVRDISMRSLKKGRLVGEVCGFPPSLIEGRELKVVEEAAIDLPSPQAKKSAVKLPRGFNTRLESALSESADSEQLINLLKTLSPSQFEQVFSSYQGTGLGFSLMAGAKKSLTNNEILLLKFFALNNSSNLPTLLNNASAKMKATIFSHPVWSQEVVKSECKAFLGDKRITFMDDLTANYLLTLKPDELHQVIQLLSQDDAGKSIVKHFVKWLPDKALNPEQFGLENTIKGSGETYLKEVFQKLTKPQKVMVLTKVVKLIKDGSCDKGVIHLIENTELLEALFEDEIQSEFKLNENPQFINDFLELVTEVNKMKLGEE
ncbi:hypothetical protein SOPP22_16510 [Shewanella sp. OPT22]|nr:hypothetical protein SOPP22_16510 [Shewanella sp. OPT22]